MLHEPYLWLKALHLIAVMSWMAGMLYLPRLFVYHTGVQAGSEADAMLQTMERRLLRFIINPAMFAVFILGGLLVWWRSPQIWQEGWWHAKLLLVVLMSAAHGFMAACRKKFARGQNTRSAKFYRILNEIPTLLMVLIVLLAVLKPF